MNESAKNILARLLKTKPKPTEKALKEFFVAIKGHSISELLEACKEIGAPGASPIEATVKQRLRKVGGKAEDFIPYLWEEAGLEVAPNSLPKKPTLSAALEAIQNISGRDAIKTIEAA